MKWTTGLHLLTDAHINVSGTEQAFSASAAVLAKFWTLRFSGSRENQELAGWLANWLAWECFEYGSYFIKNATKWISPLFKSRISKINQLSVTLQRLAARFKNKGQ